MRQTESVNPRTPASDQSALRRQNLQAVLVLVHRTGGVTRAELTKTLGLNRSTIGDLVAALAAAGWVDEVDDAPREGAGRPSPRVVARLDRLVAAINPELDAIDVALVGLGGRVVARKRVPVSSPTVEQTVTIAQEAVRELAEFAHPSQVVAAGVAVPGLVRRSDGVVSLAPHLGWRESPLAEPLQVVLGVPVQVANDAHLGCRAESVFGAGRDARTLVYLNGGPSGIGGGIIIEGIAIGGRDGYAGEIGHLSVSPAGPVCACGARGCLEALVRREHLASVLGLLDPDDDALEHALLHSTDYSVAELVEEQWRWVRIALRGVVNQLNPERVILGGFLAMLWRVLPRQTQVTALDDALEAAGRGVEIVPAALGADRLVLGAAEIAWDQALADPLGHPVSSVFAEAHQSAREVAR